MFVSSVLTSLLLLIIEMNVLINRESSIESFQLRRIGNFENGDELKTQLIDTPKHKNQGFIVDVACGNFLNIFNQVQYKHWIKLKLYLVFELVCFLLLLQDDFKIIFKNNNIWLFVDFHGDNETELAVCTW